jgi:hypothetical protein
MTTMGENQMKIELRSIRVHIGLSEETYAYTATLYVNGKKAVEVSNQGHGGCDHQHSINGADVAAIDNWCERNLPKWGSEFDDEGDIHDTTLEMWCSGQVALHLTRQDMKRVLKRHPVFIKEGTHGLFEMKFKGVRSYDPRMAKIVRDRHPTATILNELPEDAALGLYREHGCAA